MEEAEARQAGRVLLSEALQTAEVRRTADAELVHAATLRAQAAEKRAVNATERNDHLKAELTRREARSAALRKCAMQDRTHGRDGSTQRCVPTAQSLARSPDAPVGHAGSGPRAYGHSGRVAPYPPRPSLCRGPAFASAQPLPRPSLC